MRLRNDPESRPFAEYLLRVGDGNKPAIEDEAYIGGDAPPSVGRTIELLPDITRVSSQEELIECIFPQVAERFHEPGFINNRAILAPKNTVVNIINDLIAQRIPGEEQTYSDSVAPQEDQVIPYSAEFLNILTPPGMPPHELRLKDGVPVIVLRNLDPSSGICNGTRLIVRRLHRNVILAKIVGGAHDGEEVHIPRITMSTTGHRWPFTLQRRQFPLQLAFAMTINKAQGQTLSRVGVYLEEPVFTHGQLYVALSRATRVADVTVYSNQGDQTTNVVYTELLQN